MAVAAIQASPEVWLTPQTKLLIEQQHLLLEWLKGEPGSTWRIQIVAEVGHRRLLKCAEAIRSKPPACQSSVDLDSPHPCRKADRED